MLRQSLAGKFSTRESHHVLKWRNSQGKYGKIQRIWDKWRFIAGKIIELNEPSSTAIKNHQGSICGTSATKTCSCMGAQNISADLRNWGSWGTLSSQLQYAHVHLLESNCEFTDLLRWLRHTLVSALEHVFPFSWECHNSNWLSLHHFSVGWGSTTRYKLEDLSWFIPYVPIFFSH